MSDDWFSFFGPTPPTLWRRPWWDPAPKAVPFDDVAFLRELGIVPDVPAKIEQPVSGGMMLVLNKLTALQDPGDDDDDD